MSLYIIYLGTLGTLGTRINKWQSPEGFVEMLWFRVRGRYSERSEPKGALCPPTGKGRDIRRRGVGSIQIEGRRMRLIAGSGRTAR
jgi:hypothetical protein